MKVSLVGTKSIDKSGDLIIVKIGVLQHLINQPLRTSLYRGSALLKSAIP
jgi:hypothetical protein